MMLWSDYVKERLGWSTIEKDGGFITYDIKTPHASIEEFYVAPEKRGTRLAKELADEVFSLAREKLCVKMWARVTPGMPGAEHAMRTNLHYGFKLSHIAGNDIILCMDIKED